MLYETLSFETKGEVGIVTLNRPEQLNAMNGQLLEDLSDLLDRCDRNENIRALVLTGAGRAFCAGADVKYVNSLETPADFTVFSTKTRQTFHKIEVFRKPVIVALNGAALGGGLEMALCADIRIASETAKIGLTETKLGSLPGAGGTQRLPRMIGPALAKQLIFTGNFIDGGEAYRIGLVNEITTPEDCLNRAIELAAEISERAPLAVQAAKKCINTALEVNLESGLDFEIECANGVNASEDHKEGFLSFVEKRKPVWSGR